MTISEAVERRDQTPAPTKPREVVRHLLDSNKAAIGASLPTGYSQDRFVRLLLTAANTNPDLFDCDPRSFLAAGVAAAQLGLEPNDARGLAYLLPYKDKRRGKVVQLILGYRGLMDLARRSGMVSSIHAFPVFRDDEFSYSLGLEPTLHHVPAGVDESPDALTHVYAVAKVQGDPQFVVLTRAQVDTAMAQSPSARYGGPWKSHYVEMAIKTAIRRLAKWLPQTAEMATALASDERDLVIGDLGEIGHQPFDSEHVVDVTTGELTERSDVVEATSSTIDDEAAPGPDVALEDGSDASAPPARLTANDYRTLAQRHKVKLSAILTFAGDQLGHSVATIDDLVALDTHDDGIDRWLVPWIEKGGRT